MEMLKNKLPLQKVDVISTLDDNYEIIELLVNKEKLLPVKDIEARFHCIISGIIKDGNVRIPQKADIVGRGDRIVCTIHNKDKGKAINYLCKEIFL
jgi:trk system potassium uptake protein TrkA